MGALGEALMYVYDKNSLHYSYNEKYFRQNLQRNQNKYFIFTIFFSKIIIFMNYFEKIRYSLRWQHNTAQTHSMLYT